MSDALRPLSPPEFPVHLRAILEQPYPRFSAPEMARRRKAIEAAMIASGVDHLVIYGANRFGGAVQWLTQWPVTTEAACVLSPDRRDKLFIQYHNHVRQAGLLAREADVVWGGDFGLASTIEELRRRGARRDRVGLIGPLGFRFYAQLGESFGNIADLTPAYMRLRLIKSAEEIERLRLGALLSDLGIAALRRALRPGLSERELGAIVEAAYLPYGGTNQIHFFGLTAMADPDCCVPQQFPSTRRTAIGDVLFTEISALFWDYSGQVLRSFAIGADPTPLYRDLHQAADAAFEAIIAVLRAGGTPEDLVKASEVIEAAGFTTNDDIVHGYGGGYLAPILGSRSRPAGPIPEMKFAAGMTVVVQPNVVTRDGRAGVQTGELVRITETGIERLHTTPRGFFRV